MLRQNRGPKDSEINEIKLNAFEQGMRDAQAGRTVNGSPFSRHSREWVRWFSGWQNYYCNQHRKMVAQ